MTFQDFNFNEHLAEGLDAMGYTTPTPIQAMAIPVIMTGKDLIACAQTGTGKTASYLLPVLNKIGEGDKSHINTLILAPTRELAQQIDQQVEGLAYFTGISSVAVFGGGDGIVYEQQRRAIQNNVDVVIATPGRLIAHLTSGVLKMDRLQHLILDEADRMLDMGFYDDITRIIRHLPADRQTLLFSATMPPRIRQLANSIMRNPEQINIAISQPAVGIDQQMYRVFDNQKIPLIKKILAEGNFLSTIIFSSTKEKVKEVYKELRSAKLKVMAFSSDFKQSEREEILRDFKNKTLPIIIGTDALSRGIDVEGIDLVINYDAPPDPEDYIHRIGRTARAATTGTAITLINHRDEHKLRRIEQMIGKPVPQKQLPEELGEAPGPVPERTRHHNHNDKRGGGNRPSGGGKPSEGGENKDPKKRNKKKKWPRRKPKGDGKPNEGSAPAPSSPVTE
ncbi:DEAD/DEAH box helicase [Mucilaginibacter mali]|uniref:DEAD/DEAH box helicase n=1 Tax=Mucilaginibacter mali TaxID=2740462 RepID=A0A7D4Q399_9SPHI|nr:DEAD/DEAH box helicase [Mucilaginibacter mali]QKJ30167.1 DEAD/DEAH box helicase [Mucilaginibacter mali]